MENVIKENDYRRAISRILGSPSRTYGQSSADGSSSSGASASGDNSTTNGTNNGTANSNKTRHANSNNSTRNSTGNASTPINTTDATKTASNAANGGNPTSYFTDDQLLPVFRSIYSAFRGFFDGISSPDSYKCVSTSEGFFYYVLIFYQYSFTSANYVIVSYYAQKMAEQYSILIT